MGYQYKNDAKSKSSSTKSIYISDSLFSEIEKIAAKNQTSYNSVIISMLQYCVDNQETDRSDSPS